MNAAKHTPGPWHRNIPPAIKYVVIWSGRNTHVAKLTDDSRVSEEEAEANINLIASSPCLLQMLHECAEYIAALNGEQDDYCQRARALIARATGEPTAIGIQYSSWCDKHSRGTPCDKCAHLTAAEPDLLSVAYQASFALRQLLPNDLDAQMTVRMLEAAIAKATGASS